MVFFDDKAATINDLIGAIEAIELELGLTPAGVYASVRTRLDILEARINNPFAPAPNVENPFFIGNDGVTISTGFGFPTENRIPGSLYLREDGYNAQGLYARRPDGYWHQIDTDPWTANGDLAGTIYTQTVIGIQNRPVSATAPQTDSEGDGYVLTWNQGTAHWEPQIGFFAASDLSGNKISQTVIRLQGRPLSAAAPLDGYAITWNATSVQWEPRHQAVVFDAVDSNTTTNIRSNRYATQSPLLNTKAGIVNLGSDTTQATTGVTGNYASILGGDQNIVSADYSSIVTGLGSSVNGTRAFIGAGTTNSILLNANNSFIGTGVSNIVGGMSAGVVAGANNTVTSNQSFVGAGNTNQITGGSEHSIVGGTVNSITAGVSSAIVGGGNNLITDNGNSFIGAGNNNKIQFGQYNFVGSGSANEVDGTRSSILNGNGNLVANNYSAIIGGLTNIAGGTYALIGTGAGNNIVTSAAFSNMILNGITNTTNGPGSFNTIINGTLNTLVGSYSLILGGSNNSVNDGYSLVHGLNNTTSIGSTYATVFGNNNSVAATAPHGTVIGSFGVARLPGQFVLSAHNWTSPGDSQFSRVIIDGTSAGGSQILLQIPGDGYITMEDGKSYDINVRILVNNTTGTPTCARFVYDILAHQEGGVLVLDSVTKTLETDNGTGWSTTIGTPTGNALPIAVNGSGTFTRRAIATVEWREISRL
jgi:hypothetical protein